MSLEYLSLSKSSYITKSVFIHVYSSSRNYEGKLVPTLNICFVPTLPVVVVVVTLICVGILWAAVGPSSSSAVVAAATTRGYWNLTRSLVVGLGTGRGGPPSGSRRGGRRILSGASAK